jgi:hypothetical protein
MSAVHPAGRVAFGRARSHPVAIKFTFDELGVPRLSNAAKVALCMTDCPGIKTTRYWKSTSLVAPVPIEFSKIYVQEARRTSRVVA